MQGTSTRGKLLVYHDMHLFAHSHCAQMFQSGKAESDSIGDALFMAADDAARERSSSELQESNVAHLRVGGQMGEMRGDPYAWCRDGCAL